MTGLPLRRGTPCRRRLMSSAATVALFAVGAAACGVPTQDEFTVIDPEDAPFAIETTVATETTDVSDEAAAPTALYLIDASNLLVPHPRADLGSISLALELLASPDSAGEVSLRTALPQGVIVGVVVTGRSLVAVDLDPSFVDLPAEEQLLAIAQVVLTATESVRSMLVAFSIGGSPIEVPRGDSSVGSGAVTRRDYQSLLAPGP